MKRKNLTTKLFLKKKMITSLTVADAGGIKGGNSAAPSCIACIPPTEPEGCSNGCPTIIADKTSHCGQCITEPPTWFVNCGVTA
ncbi:class I lanthipeptide [Taibaiella koreensis]|uniref:class I lanthipeptide n=1 Tax=Taibaiella koreensis TaxID=1268548 RepID=UPI0013C2A588|nr:class I lanthipeptide [Taibaiella koreensis]